MPREKWQSRPFSRNAAILLQMTKSKATVLQQQVVELPGRAQPGKWEVPSRLSCKSALLCSALLCFAFLPPTPLTGRPDCENYCCTSWSGLKFHMGSKILGERTWIILLLCCSIRMIIHALQLRSILQTKPCVVVVTTRCRVSAAEAILNAVP